MACSAVLQGGRFSSDLVRVVTDVVRVRLGHAELTAHLEELDEVLFWRLPPSERKLNAAGVVALAKFFVLEWSTDLEYRLYNQLPLTMRFG